VDGKTVAAYRPSSEIPKIATRTVERGGATYQQDTSNIGRRASWETRRAWDRGRNARPISGSSYRPARRKVSCCPTAAPWTVTGAEGLFSAVAWAGRRSEPVASWPCEVLERVIGIL